MAKISEKIQDIPKRESMFKRFKNMFYKEVPEIEGKYEFEYITLNKELDVMIQVFDYKNKPYEFDLDETNIENQVEICSLYVRNTGDVNYIYMGSIFINYEGKETNILYYENKSMHKEPFGNIIKVMCNYLKDTDHHLADIVYYHRGICKR